MVRRSPQEKKALSYAKDRRNWYGENDKSSRKNIPRAKRRRNRVDRRREGVVARATGPVDLVAAEQCEAELWSIRPGKGYWRKWPDAPLSVVVAARLRRRARVNAVANEADG
ncbi:hypothetical protein [Nocardia sp. NPDC051833]|uniref:hypothetical protein n=1 Tax=Nocardia sp. NPDC051833 TaxID=3155674 RepID=UPI00343F6FE3